MQNWSCLLYTSRCVSETGIVAYTTGENGMLSGRLYAEKKDTHAEKLLSDAERQTAEWVLQNGQDVYKRQVIG